MNEKWMFFVVLGLVACTDSAPSDGGGGGVGGGSGGGGGVGGVADDAGSGDCEGPPGLYRDDACEVVADDVVAYAPRFPLWTDGAVKERYISVPPGTRIDASDPDAWIFPIGTRLWKTFIVDGKRIETRVLEKVDEGDGIAAWDYVAYAWDEAQRAVAPVPQGVTNALGTAHDIPSRSDCEQCHASVARDMVLGFSAIQLNHEATEIDLETLNVDGWFESGQAVSTSDADVPGDATAIAALGYLHGNCGHCHGDGGLVSAPAGLSMRLRVADSTVEGTRAYITAVEQAAYWVKPPPDATPVNRIEPGQPDDSAVLLRMQLGEMPLIGTDVVDPAGLSAVGAWITSLGS